MAPSLDPWLPDYHVRSLQRRVSRADPDSLWEAAGRVRISDTRILRPLIGARLGPHAPPAQTTFRELFRSGVFTLLEEGDHSLDLRSGGLPLVAKGRIRQLRVGGGL